MFDFLQRQEAMLGTEAVLTLETKTVMVCGLGGVGSSCAEGLCRAGIGHLVLIDNDEVNITNLNRQLIATRSAIGLKKTEAEKMRMLDINPDIKLTCLDLFLTNDNIPTLLEELKPDYVVDCIDNVSAKISLAVNCEKTNIKLVSSMGTGNKLYPEMLEFCDIYKTLVCPLARVMRKELKERNVKKLTCLYSKEQPIKAIIQDPNSNRNTPASVSFVPPAAGFMLCAKVVRDFIGKDE